MKPRHGAHGHALGRLDRASESRRCHRSPRIAGVIPFAVHPWSCRARRAGTARPGRPSLRQPTGDGQVLNQVAAPLVRRRRMPRRVCGHHDEVGRDGVEQRSHRFRPLKSHTDTRTGLGRGRRQDGGLRRPADTTHPADTASLTTAAPMAPPAPSTSTRFIQTASIEDIWCTRLRKSS